MKGLEFLNFCGELFSASRESKVASRKSRKTFHEELLKKVGLYDARNFEIHTYSKGMRQRLGFAQALVNDPQYLFLDEPLDGLDPIGRREMKEVIFALKKRGNRYSLAPIFCMMSRECATRLALFTRANCFLPEPSKIFAGDPRLKIDSLKWCNDREKNNVTEYTMAIIKKKTWPIYFEAILSGKKNYDLRLNDFDIKEGDVLVLEEWDPESKEYTGRKIEKKVTYVGKFRDRSTVVVRSRSKRKRNTSYGARGYQLRER